MRRAGGYVLPATLALLLLLAVVAARLDERVALLRQTQGAALRWAQAQAQLAAAREQVLLAMVTRPLTPLGFRSAAGLLRVDGRPYRLPDGVRVSVQDLRGLISIAVPDPVVLRAFLAQRGVPDAQIEPLLDKLADYGDTDDLRRLHGAEKEDYRALGLPPPRNDWPISPYELRRVAGWHARPELWLRAGDWFTATREGEVNPNTAPREVLLALPGATAEGVAALLRAREAAPLLSPQEVAAVSGIRLGPDHQMFYPGVLYRVRLWLPPQEAPGALEYTVMLVPAAPRLPWLILDARVVARPDADDAVDAFPDALDASPAPPGQPRAPA